MSRPTSNEANSSLKTCRISKGGEEWFSTYCRAVRAIQLETIALRAIASVERGTPIEDDFVECKRDWPMQNKSRQLAGSLNRAAGDPVIYLIGVDEGTGTFPPITALEVSDWWAQLISEFDQVTPELVRHMTVPFGEQGQSIVALAIASDRAPYLVKTGTAKPSLEVPIREGSGTRTAKRDELLRMLIPTITVPNATVLTCSIGLSYNSPYSYGSTNVPQHYNLSGSVRAFVEPVFGQIATLPVHSMQAKVTIGQFTVEPTVVAVVPNRNTNVGSAVETLADGITVTRPGAVALSISTDFIDLSDLTGINPHEDAILSLQIPVVHASKPIELRVEVKRSPEQHSTAGLSQFMNWDSIN
jgi:hypothetical protein